VTEPNIKPHPRYRSPLTALQLWCDVTESDRIRRGKISRGHRRRVWLKRIAKIATQSGKDTP
jgi:hypothetical protein